jgi:hypothetical protein
VNGLFSQTRYFLIALEHTPVKHQGATVMANKAQDHLHRLIRSMSRAEKRYFKVHSGRHVGDGQAKYHKLFDAIAAVEEYDEQAVIAQFSSEAFTHRFAITKRRLYESVLESLEAFHAEGSIDARLGRMLHTIRLLHDRSLYDDAAKLLHSFERLARAHDRQPMLLAAMEWQRRLAERDNYVHATEQQLNELAERRAALEVEQSELDGLWALKTRIFLLLYRKGLARDAATLKALNDLLKDPLLDEKRPALSAKAAYLRHHIRSAVAFTMNDLPTCYAQLNANLQLFESEHDRFEQEPQVVLSVLGNLAFVCVALGRFDEARIHLMSFRNAPSAWNMPETEDLDLKLFNTSMSLELGMHLRAGRPDLALELVPQIERGLDRYGERIGPMRRTGFLYQIAYAHFMAGLKEPALRWTNRLLDGLRTDDASDLAAAGRTLYLALLIESGKRDLLGYALRNTERFFQNRERMHRFEPLLLELVRQWSKARNADEEMKAFQHGMSTMGGLMNDPLERSMIDQFDALAWTESKVTGRPMAELVRERSEGFSSAA